MDRKRYLTIPLNNSAMDDYYNGVENGIGLLEWIISESEFQELMKSKVFEMINHKCGIMIDDFESEIIEGENIEKALEIIKDTYGSNPNSVLKMLLNFAQKALDSMTLIGFDF